MATYTDQVLQHHKFESTWRYTLRIHLHQKRNSGKPYWTHPKQVLRTFIKYYKRKLGWRQAATAVAHDTLEHGGTFEDLKFVSCNKVAHNVLAISHGDQFDRSTDQGRWNALVDKVSRTKEQGDWLWLMVLCDVFVNTNPQDLNPKWSYEDCKRYEKEKRYVLSELSDPWPEMSRDLSDRLDDFHQAYVVKFKGSTSQAAE